LSDSAEKTQDATTRAAQSGAISADSLTPDADLAALVTAWPSLSKATRQAIIKLVKEPASD